MNVVLSQTCVVVEEGLSCLVLSHFPPLSLVSVILSPWKRVHGLEGS